ncbi:MAG TPA: adhesin [Sulfuricurvum sp.]|nr:adhesin [Sulfuricurvum sp.]
MMKFLLFLTLIFTFSYAKITVAVSYPYIASLVDSIGGDNVDINTLAQGNWDPHFVSPKPSLIVKLRNADALIINGGDLEIGWLPPLLEKASNSRLNQSANVLDLSRKVALIDVPKSMGRENGDVHADGNPHFHLDPHNIPLLAEAVSVFLSQKDPLNASQYRKNLTVFKQQWTIHLKHWDSQMAPLRGKNIVQYHPVFNYFIRAYGMKSIGTIEPLAGIPPSSSHTMQLIALMNEKKPFCIMHDVYHPTKTGEFISDKTGIKLAILPHDVGATSSATELYSLFASIIQALR